MSFTFKQFHIEDDQCAMKVGTDSILLGSWVVMPNSGRVLDIGCGSGLLSLMLAQRMAHGMTQGEGAGRGGVIVAVEIDAKAAVQAQQNIDRSPWSGSISVYQGDINHYATGQDDGVAGFALIISNPPYFSDSLQGPTDVRNNARHTNNLTQQQLLDNVVRLLTNDGLFCVILPTTEARLLIALGEAAGLYLQQVCQVSGKRGKPARRQMMAFAKSEPADIWQQNIDIHDENDQYSKQFIALTQNFYLNT